MSVFFHQLLLLFLLFILFCTPVSLSEAGEAKSYLSAGIGVEQLTYTEQISELELSSSNTELTNLVLFLEGRKALGKFFIGARGHLPLSTDGSQEYWTRAGEFEQTNSLTYRWIRLNGHAGYFFHPLLNPYIGIGWGYAEQERSNFENVNAPELFNESVTEKAYSFSTLFGIQGHVSFAPKWSLIYFAEYLLPFYSNTTNTGLPGWEASNIGGYAYCLTGRLHYDFTETASVALQVSGGTQHWEGSDWIPIGGSSAKWPENDTDFISGFISINKYF